MKKFAGHPETVGGAPSPRLAHALGQSKNVGAITDREWFESSNESPREFAISDRSYPFEWSLAFRGEGAAPAYKKSPARGRAEELFRRVENLTIGCPVP